MISERKKKFLAAKKEAGGSVSALVESLKNRPYKLFFDKSGNITYFGQETFDVPESWETYNFSQEQLAVLKNADTSKYIIYKDKLVENLYSIRPKTFEISQRTISFLEEVLGNEMDGDVLCEITKDKVSFRFSKQLRNRIGESSLTAKNMVFYLTAKNDPHWLFKKITVPTERLLKKKITYAAELDIDLRTLSLYTRKIFDSYTLRVL